MPGTYMGGNRDKRNFDRQPSGQRGKRTFDQAPAQRQPQQQNQGEAMKWKEKLEALLIVSGAIAKPCNEELIQQVIRTGGKLLVDTAEKLGPFFLKTKPNGKRDEGNSLTTSQIRNIFGMVKKMEMSGFDSNEFVLLRPKLSYAAARAKADGAYQFAEVLTWAVKEVDTDGEKFERFVDFFEAILAYHKAAGGK